MSSANPPLISRRLALARGMGATLVLPGFGGLLAPAALAREPYRRAPRRSFGAPGVAPGRAVLPLVMLDPGHGGKDPGAIGVSGTYEKHIAALAASEFRNALERSGRYRVELTRSRDVFIPLEERVAIAQSRGAALFISMHADALVDRAVRGASVYTLSTTASDAQTAALARTENSADRFAGPDFLGTPPEVRRILGSLVRQETRVDSAHMAGSVVRAFTREVGLLERPDRHADFVVLKSTEIPSVLVEMGFMSNGADEAALRQPAHRALISACMIRAVDLYFAASGHFTRMAG